MPSPSVTPGGHPAGGGRGPALTGRPGVSAGLVVPRALPGVIRRRLRGRGGPPLAADGRHPRPRLLAGARGRGPALVVFVIPGILAARQGRVASRLGHPQGRLPARIGALIGLGFVGLNVASYLVGLAAARWT